MLNCQFKAKIVCAIYVIFSTFQDPILILCFHIPAQCCKVLSNYCRSSSSISPSLCVIITLFFTNDIFKGQSKPRKNRILAGKGEKEHNRWGRITSKSFNKVYIHLKHVEWNWESYTFLEEEFSSYVLKIFWRKKAIK